MLRDEDDEDEYKDWSTTVERPWWETSSRFDQPSETEVGEAELRGELVSFIVPSGLLATFKTILLGESNFPHGFYCRTCGRINVQTSLVRQDCATATCAASSSACIVPPIAAEWVPARGCVLAMADSAWVPAVVTRVLKLDGMSTRTYSVPTGSDIYTPRSQGIPLHMTVTHIFTSNMVEHQRMASARFVDIQRHIPFHRSKSDFTFVASATFPPSSDDWGNRAAVLDAFNATRNCVTSRVAVYGDGIGHLEVKKLTVKTWIVMKHSKVCAPQAGRNDCTSSRCTQVKENLPVQTEDGVLAIMCLGANTQVSYTPVAMKPAMKSDVRYKAAARKDALRVVLIHGDVLVLSGAAIEVGGFCAHILPPEADQT